MAVDAGKKLIDKAMQPKTSKKKVEDIISKYTAKGSAVAIQDLVNPGQWATRFISARPDDRRWPSLAECRCGLSLRRYIPLSIQILSLKTLPGT